MRSTYAVFICLLAVSSFGLTSAADDIELLLSNDSEPHTMSNQEKVNATMNIFRGIFLGVGSSLDWKNVEPCIDSNKDVIENTGKGIVYFLNGTKNISNIVNGLYYIGKAMTSIPSSMEKCGATGKDISKLVKMLKTLNTTELIALRIVKNAVLNIIDIPAFISNIRYGYNSGNWMTLGINIGKLLGEVVLVDVHIEGQAPLCYPNCPKEDTEAESNAPENVEPELLRLPEKVNATMTVIRGMFLGIASNEGWKNMESCINSNQEAMDSIVKGISYFVNGTKNTSNIINGLYYLGKALTNIPTSIEKCGANSADVEKMLKPLNKLNSTSAIAWHLSKNTVLNILDLTAYIHNIGYAYNNEKWMTLGVNIGALIDEVFLVSPQIIDQAPLCYPNCSKEEIQALNLPQEFLAFQIEFTNQLKEILFDSMHK